MFGFVTSQISMKLHQYLDGFDILLTTPLFIRFFFAINISPIPMKMKHSSLKTCGWDSYAWICKISIFDKVIQDHSSEMLKNGSFMHSNNNINFISHYYI